MEQTIVQNLEESHYLYHLNEKKFIHLHDNFIIGRKEGDAVITSDEKLSRQHCQFKIEGLNTYLVDLNSTNKTYLNGESVKEKQILLKENDQIRIGQQTFIYSHSSEEKLLALPNQVPSHESTAPVTISFTKLSLSQLLYFAFLMIHICIFINEELLYNYSLVDQFNQAGFPVIQILYYTMPLIQFVICSLFVYFYFLNLENKTINRGMILTLALRCTVILPLLFLFTYTDMLIKDFSYDLTTGPYFSMMTKQLEKRDLKLARDLYVNCSHFISSCEKNIRNMQLENLITADRWQYYKKNRFIDEKKFIGHDRMQKTRTPEVMKNYEKDMAILKLKSKNTRHYKIKLDIFLNNIYLHDPELAQYLYLKHK